jgi:DNA-binding NarL/FixJ family response regulator/class 3 adenylate cyclase
VRNDVTVPDSGVPSEVPDVARPVPAGTVTVLFADVEGSTALLERLGQARWLQGLADYEALLTASIAEHGGTLVKALGDGHLLAFPSARAGLRCAIHVQRALPLESAPDVRVRMGMHTGEPAVREDDLHGRTVVKAARIADLARGGEILVSSVVRELAETDEDLGQELWFEEAREVELRGLRGRHLVMAARWDPLARGALRVVIADDSALVRDGVAAVLRECGVHVSALAGDADSLYREVERHRPDVALVDIRMPPTNTNEGLVAAEHIGRHYPEVAVLVLSQYLEFSYAMRLVEDREARRGYLLKDRVSEMETLLDAIRRVAHGGTVVDPAIVEELVSRPATGGPLAGLSAREREVLGLVAEGFSDGAIAERLGLTPDAVETDVEQIFLKLGLRDEHASDRRVAAVLAYLRATLVR